MTQADGTRGITAAERVFVVSSFASNYRHHTGIVSDAVYRHCVLEPFEEALPRLDVQVLRVPGMDDEFMGWRASRGKLLVYLYVKKEYRDDRYGVAKALIPSRVETVAFATSTILGYLGERGMYPKPRPWAVFDLLAETPHSEKA